MDEAKIREWAEKVCNENYLAKYAGRDGHRDWWSGGTWFRPDEFLLKMFPEDLREAARSLLAAEREECARICDAEAEVRVNRYHNPLPGDDKMAQGHKEVTARKLAAAIRGKP